MDTQKPYDSLPDKVLVAPNTSTDKAAAKVPVSVLMSTLAAGGERLVETRRRRVIRRIGHS